MLDRLRQVLIGAPLPSQEMEAKRLNKIRALAAFSPDALSSIAYANQEIYLGLLVAGSAGLMIAWPIGIAITGLLIIVAISYFQTIQGYPKGGGSYIVARDNLGRTPSLIAAAALMVDYLLTAAVSLTAGVEAIASAFPILWNYRVQAALILLALIAWINLRGLQETGTLMAIPVYLFLGTFIPMLIIGVYRLLTQGPILLSSTAPPASQPLTTLLVLHAFASGCTALTGIEAISDGVLAFRTPQSKNAQQTLIAMAILMGILFIGSIGLTQALGVIAAPQETILSALARSILGSGPAFILVQFSTLLILTVAANTSFADFPRVAAFLAKDGYLPRQLTGLGDRLVYANGILLLAALACMMIILFGGDTHALVPLFAVGAFMAFTLSQSGMVLHWWRERGRLWLLKAGLNGIGAIATAGTLLVVGISKFMNGAWITFLIIPLFVTLFIAVHLHYQSVSQQLSMSGLPPSLKASPKPRVVIPVSGVHRGVVDAVSFALSITDEITAVYIELEQNSGEQVRAQWERWWPSIPLVILPSPYRSLIGPLLNYLDETDRTINDGQLATIVLPEFIPASWWHSFLHNQSSSLIKTALLYRRRIHGYQRVIIDLPYHLKR